MVYRIYGYSEYQTPSIMTIYCAAVGCGGVADYTAVKPTHCPKCKQPFSAAFAATTAPAPATPRASTQVAPARAARRSFTTPPSGARVQAARFPGQAQIEVGPNENEQYDDETLAALEQDAQMTSDDEIAAYAEELKRGLTKGAVRVSVSREDGPVRFDSLFSREG